jgi:anaerobic magnesium-protoporphyrin IX monomethyl ester cyclase
MKSIRVFISYSHDSREHQRRILELSNRLRSDGIDCYIDQYEVNPPEGWPTWTERQFRRAQFIIVVCTESYARRFEGDERVGIGMGAGAAYESMLTRNWIFALGAVNEKFIPLILSAADARFIPDPLKGSSYICLASGDEDYAQLYRRLLGLASSERPPVGELKQQFGLGTLAELSSQPGFTLAAQDGVVHYPPTVPVRTSRLPRAGTSIAETLSARPVVIGRTNELDRLVQLLLTKPRHLALHGEHGIGKRTLALTATHRLVDQHSHGAYLWIQSPLSGLTLNELLDQMARALGAEYLRRFSLAQKAAGLNRLLHEVQTLVIVSGLDGSVEPLVLQFLGNLPPTCQLLSTAETVPYGAVSFPIGPLDAADAVALARIEAQIGTSANFATDGHVDIEAALRVCAGNPLALRWAMGFLHAGIDLPVDLVTGGAPVAALFDHVYATSSESGRRVLLAFSLFADAATLDALSHVAAVPRDDTEAEVNRLVGLRLCTPVHDSAGTRHELDRVTQRLAAMLDHQSEDGAARKASFVDYYRDFSATQGGLDTRTGVDQMHQERLNLLRALVHCRETGRSQDFVAIQMRTSHMLWAHGYWHDNMDTGAIALQYARTHYRYEAAAWIQMECLGWTAFCRGDYDQARRHYQDADQTFRTLPRVSPVARARLCNYMGRLLAAEENHVEAIRWLWEGLRYSEDDLTTSFLESALGDVYMSLRQFEPALSHYRSVLTYRERTSDGFRLCTVLCDVAELEMKFGRAPSARGLFVTAVRLAEQMKRLDVCARAHYGLGQLDLANGERTSARRHLMAAIELFAQLGQERQRERAEALLPQVNSSTPYTLDMQTAARGAGGQVEALLVNCPRDVVRVSDHRCQDYRPPLGLASIAAFLKRRGVTVRLLDAEAESVGMSGIVDTVLQAKPAIIGLNCHTLNRHTVYEIARTIRSVLPHAPLIVGGAHPSLAAELTLRECPVLDAVAIGEGERVMYELCRRPRECWDAVPGIGYLRDGQFCRTPDMPRIQNLDSIGLPALEDLPMEQYLSYSEPALPGLWKRAYINASRGCRFKCSFCTEHGLWSTSPSFRSADSVIAEMTEYRNRFGINRFYFYDDLLTDWKELWTFCERAPRLNALWSCSTRIDEISRSTVERLAAAGCREIAFGLESGSGSSLRLMRKGWQARCTLEEVGERLRMCADRQITPRAHFMIGFPWETRADITATVEFAVRLKDQALTDANFFVVKVYPGTPFHHDLGRVQAELNLTDSEFINLWSVHDWHMTRNQRVSAKLRRFNDIPVVSLHSHLDSLSLRRLVRNAYEIFFSDVRVDEVQQRLWIGVGWEERPDSTSSGSRATSV